MQMDNKTFWEEVEEKTFSPFFKERIHKVIFLLQSKCGTGVLETANIWSGIAVDLYETFYQASVRTLIAEIHAYKNAGMLSGKTAGEEYAGYCDILKNNQYINSVYQRYPGLLHYLNEIEKMQLLFWQECLERLTDDWGKIVNYFHMPGKTQVASVRKSGSDSHCGGKSVVIIEPDSGKRIFYKPHSLENEIFLQEFTGDIYNKLGIKGFRYSVLGQKDYGWVEEVPWQACGSEGEISRFYRRFGILAAIAYIFGLGDLHYENLIAHGEYPVIIDAETLFEHMDPIYEWSEKTTGFYSALSSGLFPGGTADLNTAGISGGTGGTSSKEIPAIMNDKTSEICVGYQKVSMPIGKNHVQYQGVSVKWNHYGKEVIDGFQMAYRWFLAHKDWVLERVFAKENKLNSRYVSGNTQFFSLGLYASMHPELMTQEQGRYQYLLKLYQNRALGKLEMGEILKGDIPWLFRKLDDKHVYCGSGKVQTDFFPHTIKEQFISRMDRLSEEDCELQKKAIELSCRIFGEETENKKDNIDYKQECNSKDSFHGIEYAKEIAEYILSNAIKQGNTIFWLEISEEAGAAKIKPVDIYFYSGIAGIAVFFRKLCQVTGLYGNICKTLETMLFLYTDRVCGGDMDSATKYPGMYCGEGSVVYAYQLLYRITGRDVYREYAGKHVKVLIECASQESPFDLLYGNAGAVLVLCQQYLDSGNHYYLDEAERVLGYLENSRIESERGITWFKEIGNNPVCSMAHGNSGVLLAYARVQSLRDKEEYIERIKKIMEYEDQFYDDFYGNWADLRKDGEERWKTYAWCNGGIGVVYARLMVNEWNSQKNIMKYIADKKGLFKNLVINIDEKKCLCHGNIGNLLVIRKLAENMDRNAKTIQRIAKILNKMIHEDLGKQIKNSGVGFMNGLSGIGEILLKKST